MKWAKWIFSILHIRWWIITIIIIDLHSNILLIDDNYSYLPTKTIYFVILIISAYAYTLLLMLCLSDREFDEIINEIASYLRSLIYNTTSHLVKWWISRPKG